MTRLHIDTPLPSACEAYAAECEREADQLVALSSMTGRLVSVDAIVARRRLRREARYAHEVARRWRATTVEKGRGKLALDKGCHMAQDVTHA